MTNKKQIAVIGCGLIGGSVIKSVLSAAPELYTIVGIDQHHATKKYERQSCKDGCKNNYIVITKSFIKSVLQKAQNLLKPKGSPYKQIKNAKIVFICSPLSSYEIVWQNINKYLKHGSTIFDLGSVQIKNDLHKSYNYIYTHPIAGSNKSGFKHSTDTMFNKKKIVISKSFDGQDVSKAVEFWSLFDCEIINTTIEEHNSIYALVSHFPQIVAFCFAKTFDDVDFSKASGLNQDFIRLCSSNKSLWKDIFYRNKQQIIRTSENFLHKINETTLVANGPCTTSQNVCGLAYVVSNALSTIVSPEIASTFAGLGFKSMTSMANFNYTLPTEAHTPQVSKEVFEKFKSFITNYEY